MKLLLTIEKYYSVSILLQFFKGLKATTKKRFIVSRLFMNIASTGLVDTGSISSLTTPIESPTGGRVASALDEAVCTTIPGEGS